MAPLDTVVASQVATGSPYQLDPTQTIRAVHALRNHLKSTVAATGRRSLLAQEHDDAALDEGAAPEEAESIWLILTTKTHVSDRRRLKPGKIALPHPLHTHQNLRICLITADPQRAYKDAVADPTFLAATPLRISRVIGVSKLSKKWKTHESRRALFAEHDVFLADDRIVTYLPQTLGKIFFKSGAKRPIPVQLAGYGKRPPEPRRQMGSDRSVAPIGKPAQIAHEVDRALQSALINISPSTTTAVKVAQAHWTPDSIHSNVKAVVEGLVTRYIPKGWRNVRSIHIKAPSTAALPVWLSDELWAQESDILTTSTTSQGQGVREQSRVDAQKQQPRRQIDTDMSSAKRKATSEVDSRERQGSAKKHKSRVSDARAEQNTTRKERLRQQKSKALADADA